MLETKGCALAEKLRTGTLELRILEAPRRFAMLRELARTQRAIGRDLVRVQAHPKSVHRSRGIRRPGRADPPDPETRLVALAR